MRIVTLTGLVLTVGLTTGLAQINSNEATRYRVLGWDKNHIAIVDAREAWSGNIPTSRLDARHPASAERKHSLPQRRRLFVKLRATRKSFGNTFRSPRKVTRAASRFTPSNACRTA